MNIGLDGRCDRAAAPAQVSGGRAPRRLALSAPWNSGVRFSSRIRSPNHQDHSRFHYLMQFYLDEN